MATQAIETELAAAREEHDALEREALAGKAGLFGKLAEAAAKVGILTKRLAAARQDEARQAAERERAAAEAARQDEIEALRARKLTAERTWALWAAEMEQIEARLAELWATWHALQAEANALAAEDARLGAGLGPIDNSPVHGHVKQMVDGASHIRYWPHAHRSHIGRW